MAETTGSLPYDTSIALKANDAEAVPQLLKEIAALGENYQADDEKTRLQLAMKARTLWKSLETPRETMLRHAWAEPSAFCALTAGTTKGLWAYLGKKNGPFEVHEVAEAMGIEAALLARLLRHICAMGYLKELGPDRYELTNFTRSMAFPFINAGYPCVAGGCMNALSKFHEWADLKGWKDAVDGNDCPLQHGFQTKRHFFEHLETNQPYGNQFHLHMGGYRQGRPAWMDAGFFPVQERLVEGFDTADDAVMLVDVGGSFGHDIGEFRRKHPNVPGRLVLQDLPEVLGRIENLDKKIERMPHDFYTEQPIKGARAYYMHSVLHDWSDEISLKILEQIKRAMKPGYSKLLINENVIPPTGAQWEATALDIMMLTLLASRERTRDNWESLFQRAGLKITNIWGVQNGVESLIELERI